MPTYELGTLWFFPDNPHCIYLLCGTASGYVAVELFSGSSWLGHHFTAAAAVAGLVRYEGGPILIGP